MNILYVIGNGFDINQGLATSYTDFYKHYVDVISEDELIVELKKSIKSDINSWSDLEFELGQYSSKLENPTEFIAIHEDIGDRLAEYLKTQEEMLSYAIIDQQKFYADIWNPYVYLNNKESNYIIQYFSNRSMSNGSIDIVTLNYTKTIESILNTDSLPMTRLSELFGNQTLNSIVHIHGYQDDRMVMGVNDIDQISNKGFRENEDIVRSFVKNECNIACGSNVELTFSSLIEEADLICIYGSSIGATDDLWWKKIGKKLEDDKLFLIVFVKHDEEISSRRSYKESSIKNQNKRIIMDKLGINVEHYAHVEKNIIISLNVKFLKVIKMRPKPIPIPSALPVK